MYRTRVGTLLSTVEDSRVTGTLMVSGLSPTTGHTDREGLLRLV